MRPSRFVPLLTSFLLAAFSSAPAGATPFSATLGLTIGGFGTFQFPGTGSGSSTANHVAVPGGLFAGTAMSALTADPPLTNITVKVSGNAPGSFTGDPLNGTMPLFGRWQVKGNLGGGPITLTYVPLFTSHTPMSGTGAVGLGIGGSVVVTIGGFYVSAFHTGWTEGMKTVTGLVYTYNYHVPAGMGASLSIPYTYLNATAMYTGTDSRTPGGLGQVTLVSPTKVVDRLYFPGEPLVQVFVTLGTLTLNFVPEPSTLLLLGLGVTAFAVLGRRRVGRSG